MTPFFAPVLPEVKMTTATSSSLTAGLSYFFAGVRSREVILGED